MRTHVATASGEQERCSPSRPVDTTGKNVRVNPGHAFQVEQPIHFQIVRAMPLCIAVDQDDGDRRVATTVERMLPHRMLGQIGRNLGPERWSEFHGNTMAPFWPARQSCDTRFMSANPSYDTLLYELTDNVLTITLNRPEKLNAFNNQMRHDIIDALDHADADDNVRAIIFTGAGRAYCAGADLSGGGRTFDREVNADGAIVNTIHRDGGGLVSLRIYECLKPTIAAVNGAAVGVGVTSMLPMDIRIASEHARFGFVFSQRGIVPEACSSYFLPRVVGISRAAEWCFTGEVFDAEEALDGGLVRSVHPADELLPAAHRLARKIADNTSAVSVTLTRHMLWRMLDVNHPMEAHKIDSRGVQYMGASADAREGVESFLEKRAPQYSLTPSADLPDYFPWWSDPEFS